MNVQHAQIVESLQPSGNTNLLGKQVKTVSDIFKEGEGWQDFGKMFSTFLETNGQQTETFAAAHKMDWLRWAKGHRAK